MYQLRYLHCWIRLHAYPHDHAHQLRFMQLMPCHYAPTPIEHVEDA